MRGEKTMTIGTQKILIDRYPNMVVNRDYTPLISRNGLLDFDRLYHFSGGHVIKQIKERSVIRMTLTNHDEPRNFFIKRHVAALPELDAFSGHGLRRRNLSPGMAEFENICDFRNHDLATVTPVAAGQRYAGRLRYESFLITEDVAPCISLEELILSHPERLSGPDGINTKRLIITAVANLARRMHDSGFNHRDFNATHILIAPGKETSDHYLGLFDLQRVDRKKCLRVKWAIKTMAEMGYTMPSPPFDEDDRRLLFRLYLDSPLKSWKYPLLYFFVIKKIKRIKKHTEKIMLRKKSLDV